MASAGGRAPEEARRLLDSPGDTDSTAGDADGPSAEDERRPAGFQAALNAPQRTPREHRARLPGRIKRNFQALAAMAAGNNERTGSPTSHLGFLRRRTSHVPLRNEPDDDLDSVDPGVPPVYEDYTTIDWVRDNTRDRVRLAKLRAQKGSFKGWVLRIIDPWEGWLVAFGIGVSLALVAAGIDISTEWLSDLKEGYCPEAFWLNKKFCCWTSSTYEDGECDLWVTWAESAGSTGSKSLFLLNYFFYVLFAVLFACLSAVLVTCLAPYAAGSGIPQVKTIMGGFVIRGFLGSWTLLVKSVALVLSVASGMSLGKEGPFVHISCCFGNIFARLFDKYKKNEAKKRELFSAATAAGIAVAFGAPVGGILFSLEEVSYYFPYKTMWRAFFCALTAIATLTYLNPLRSGRLVLFYVSYDHPWHAFETIPAVFIGALGGLYGALFIRLAIRWAAYRKASFIGRFPVGEVMAVALVTAIANYSNVYQKGMSVELIRTLFSECLPGDQSDICTHRSSRVVILLLLACGFKMIITIFTFGIKVPAGIFIPAMAIGACLGRVVGIGMHALVTSHPSWPVFHDACPDPTTCITPGLYAMMGAASVLAGITRMTVSLAVIMFEVTGGLNYILPIMIAVMTSKWVGDAFGHANLDDRFIQLNDLPFLDNKEEFVHATTVANVMDSMGDRPLFVLHGLSHTVQSLEHTLATLPYKGFPVVDSANAMLVLGYVSRNELRVSLEKARRTDGVTDTTECHFGPHIPSLSTSEAVHINMKHCLDVGCVRVTEDSPMEFVLELFRAVGLRYVLVTRHGRLSGILTKKDVLHFVQGQERH